MIDAVMARIERDRRRRAVDGNISELQQRFGSLSAARAASDVAGDGRQDEQTGSE
jgi:hypothetical protein